MGSKINFGATILPVKTRKTPQNDLSYRNGVQITKISLFP